MPPIEALNLFLHKKSIDADALRAAMPGMYAQFGNALRLGGGTYLEYAGKFQWNGLRLEFPWDVGGLKKE